jgi:hypothetical protein
VGKHKGRLAITGLTVAMAMAFPPGAAVASSGGSGYSSTPVSNSAGKPVVAGNRAKLLRNGLAAAPANAPAKIQKMIWAANKIQSKPYVYGGGHATFPVDDGYDCSGTVSYALYYGGILDGDPRDSVGFYTWGQQGEGQWLTVYANGSHAFMVIAGLRLDTSSVGDTNGASGPRWRRTLRDTSSFRARSWPGL